MGHKFTAFGAVACLAGAFFSLSHATPADAVQPQPPTDWSWYVRTTNANTLYSWGCNQGNADRNLGNINSEVILDFGGQSVNNNGTYLTGNNLFVSYATIESLAEQFAKGYYICTGSDYTSVLSVGIGTNNSAYHIDSAGGSAWASVVTTVKNWVVGNSYQSQVDVGGANDMEPGYDYYPDTKTWLDSYTSAGGPYLLDYGSADGCPQTTHTNGLCYYYTNGRSWYQDSVWYVAWGAAPAVPVPEIYFQSMANQWGQIYFWKAMTISAPLDEYDLNTGSFTSSQAWNALWNATGGSNMNYSAEIHILS